MLRGMVFENFVHFGERFHLDFSKSDSGPCIFVGASATGKTAVLELIRRCMDSELNSSLTNRNNKNERAYVFCEFDIDICNYGPVVITGMIVHGEQDKNYSKAENKEMKDETEIKETEDREDMLKDEKPIESREEDKEVAEKVFDKEEKKGTKFYKVIMYRYKAEIEFCLETYLEENDGRLVNLNQNGKLPGKLLDGMIDFNIERKGTDKKSRQVYPVCQGIKNSFNFDFVGKVISGMENAEKTGNHYKDLWIKMTKQFVGILPSRGLGSIQWTKSESIKCEFKSKNYKDSCARAEILNDLMDSTYVDALKEDKYFKFLTSPNKFVFEKEPDSAENGESGSEFDSTKKETHIFVTHGAIKFPLLKTSIGIVEAKQLSLLMAHTTLRTICYEEPDRGMHPHMIERVKEILHEESRGKTVIIATHSPYLIDFMSSENTCLFYKCDNAAYAKNISDLDEWKAVQKIILMEDLKRIIFSSQILFVEGKSDKIFLQTFIKYLIEPQIMSNEGKVNARNYEILSLGGKDVRKTVADFCKCVAIKYRCILDQDAFIKTKKEKPDEIAEIVDYPNYKIKESALKTFRDKEFSDLSELLKKEKKTFIWKDGELEDFLLSGNGVWAMIADKNNLHGKKRPKGVKEKKKYIKAALNNGLSPKESNDLVSLIKTLPESLRLQKFLEEQFSA